MQTKNSTAALTDTELNRCRLYLNYLHEHPKQPSPDGVWPPSGPSITISPLTGSGAHEVAEKVLAIFQAEEPEDGPPWCVFDRQLVAHVLAEHHLPARLEELMPEDRRSYFADVVDQFMGLRPPSWEMVPKVVQSIRHLADAGHVILVGRGAGVVAGDMANVFHVRLVASLEKRIERVQKLKHLSSRAAEELIVKTDRGRERFAKAYLHTHVDDALHYHLVINTDLMPLSDAAESIVEGARRCFQGNSALPQTEVYERFRYVA